MGKDPCWPLLFLCPFVLPLTHPHYIWYSLPGAALHFTPSCRRMPDVGNAGL